MKLIKKLYAKIVNSLCMALARRRAAKLIASIKARYPGCEGAMNINSWPPVDGTTAGYDEVGGVTSVRWGTDGLLQTKPASGFYIVTSFKQSVDQDLEYLPNGSGIKAGLITLTHGYKWECTVRDDTRWTSHPTAGSYVNITDAGGLVAAAHRSSGAAAVGSVFSARVVNPDYSAAPKQAGERVLMLEALMLVDGTAGKLVPGTAV